MRKSHRNSRARQMRACFDVLESRQLFSTFTVTSTGDVTNAGDGVTTLREAIVAANAHSGPDNIVFSASVFPAGSTKTITLGSAGQVELSDTSGATTITGPTGAIVKVSGNNASRILKVDAKVTASITGLT